LNTLLLVSFIHLTNLSKVFIDEYEEAVVKRIIDLTLPIKPGVDRIGVATSFKQVQTFKRNGWQGSSVFMHAHTGTHIDAPLHFIKGGDSIDKIPLERLIGEGMILDFTSKGLGEAITHRELAKFNAEIKAGHIVILRTDWTGKSWGKPDFFENSPYLTKDAAEWLARRKIKAVGYDFAEEFAIRKTKFKPEECVAHMILLSNGIFNIEYLTNLNKLTTKNPTIFALPIPLRGLEGAPARVIAIERN